MTELSNASKIALLQASHRTQVESIARSADNERASQDRITASTQAALLQNQLTVLQASETANALRNDSLQSTVTNMSIRHADSLNTVQTNTSSAVADLTVKHLTEIAERDRNPQPVVNINNVQTNASVPAVDASAYTGPIGPRIVEAMFMMQAILHISPGTQNPLQLLANTLNFLSANPRNVTPETVLKEAYDVLKSFFDWDEGSKRFYVKAGMDEHKMMTAIGSSPLEDMQQRYLKLPPGSNILLLKEMGEAPSPKH